MGDIIWCLLLGDKACMFTMHYNEFINRWALANIFHQWWYMWTICSFYQPQHYGCSLLWLLAQSKIIAFNDKLRLLIRVNAENKVFLFFCKSCTLCNWLCRTLWPDNHVLGQPPGIHSISQHTLASIPQYTLVHLSIPCTTYFTKLACQPPGIHSIPQCTPIYPVFPSVPKYILACIPYFKPSLQYLPHDGIPLAFGQSLQYLTTPCFAMPMGCLRTAQPEPIREIRGQFAAVRRGRGREVR